MTYDQMQSMIQKHASDLLSLVSDRWSRWPDEETSYELINALKRKASWWGKMGLHDEVKECEDTIAAIESHTSREASISAANKPLISLDNLEEREGLVLVMGDWSEVEDDQTVAGANWEHDGDFAYTLVMDHPGLVKELEEDGYELNLDEYAPPDEVEACSERRYITESELREYEEKTAQRHYSEDPQDLVNYLKGVAIVDGAGGAYHDPEADWKDEQAVVAIVHDGGGFTPGGAIYVDSYDRPGQQDEALHAAWEYLEHHTIGRERGYIQELQAEWGDEWSDIMTEGWDGKVWVLPLSEAMSIINADQFANRFVEFESV